MLIVLKIISPPNIGDKKVKAMVDDVISKNFPVSLLPYSLAPVLSSPFGVEKQGKLISSAKKKLLDFFNQEDVYPFLSSYITGVEAVVKKNKEMSSVYDVKKKGILFFSFSYFTKVKFSSEMEDNDDEYPIEPTDDEVFRQYNSPAIKVDHAFLEGIKRNELPKEVNLFLEDVFLFRASLFGEATSSPYIEDVDMEEFVHEYLSLAERTMLGYSSRSNKKTN